jgi:hypothetical protein
MVTGMRGLCNGLGPAMFSIIFYLFQVDLNEDSPAGRGRDQRPSVVGDNNTVGQMSDSIQPVSDKTVCKYLTWQFQPYHW